jgi:hypothetical protein
VAPTPATPPAKPIGERLRDAAAGHPARAFAAGVVLTIVVGVLALWGAGVFSGPEFKASFAAPRDGQTVRGVLTGGQCRVDVSGNDGATTVAFSISGPGAGRGALNTERDAPFDCTTGSSDARWNTCLGHGDQPLDNGRHTLTARAIDAKNRIRDTSVAIVIAGC